MVKVIDGEKELISTSREDISYSCVIFAVVTTIAVLFLVATYKIFFPTAVEAGSVLGQVVGLLMVIGMFVLMAIIGMVVNLIFKEEEMTIRRQDIEGKKVVCVRTIRLTSRINSRSFAVYIPGYKRKSFKISAYSMPKFQEALEQLGATVELTGSWPGINPQGES